MITVKDNGTIDARGDEALADDDDDRGGRTSC
jgi:hypothetical protein